MPETAEAPPYHGDTAAEWVPILALHPWDKNPRNHKVETVAKSMLRFGYGAPAIGRLEDKEVIAGHGRIKSANLIREWGKTGKLRYPGDPPKEDTLEVTNAAAGDIRRIVEKGEIPCRYMPLTLGEAHAYALADNQLGGEWDDTALGLAVRELREQKVDLTGLGWTADELADIINPDRDGGSGGPSLQERFLVPPFTVLDARQGYWKDRKRSWIALGIKSELGRLTLGPRSQPGSESGRWAYKAGTNPKNLALRTLGKDGGAHFARKDAGDQALHRSSNQQVEGHIFKSDSGRDPDYYAQKRAVEVQLGREITTEEFQAKYYVNAQDGSGLSASGTSVFDPVLCELAYRWFCPPTGKILDPFAGGSVRGVVACWLGRSYVGIDLSAEQVEANRQQWKEISERRPSEPLPTLLGPGDPVRLDVVALDEARDVIVARDDRLPGGTKRRALGTLLKRWAEKTGQKEFIYASPVFGYAQIALALACRDLGLKATVFVAKRSQLHPRTQAAKDAGCNVVEIEAGRLTVLEARAREYAAAHNGYLIPFGLDTDEFIDALAAVARGAVEKPPTEVWAVAGSGVVSRALQRAWPNAKHHAVVVGTHRANIGTATGYEAPEDFEKDAKDPPPFPSCSNYDAKAWAFIKAHAAPGALFWNVAADESLSPVARAASLGTPEWRVGSAKDVLEGEVVEEYDEVFTCPPYGDLEVYSEDPNDLSFIASQDRSRFLTEYREIIRRATARLKQDRFAVIVVGDYRDSRGFYSNFVSETIAAFEAAGLSYYNEAILVTTAGSLPIRMGRQFAAGRKLGKMHQNVLVFVKGDPKKATEACGEVEIGGLERDDAGDEAPLDGSEEPPVATAEAPRLVHIDPAQPAKPGMSDL